jgi:Arc/MetJ-type ribon-helix-helix transcriptional regulator
MAQATTDDPAEHLLTAEIKTRISPQQKEALEAIARGRHLKVSDIIREAIREKLAMTVSEPA